MSVNAGTIAIKQVLIYSYNNVELDITNLVAEINVYEDMFSNTMSGNLIIGDAVGLISNLPIIGHEKVKFQISSEIWGTKSFDFFVYSIAERTIENSALTNYILNFISIEAYIDPTVSKSYRGTHSDIVSKIFKDWIGTEKNIQLEQSSYDTSLVVPFWSAFEAINWISSRCTSVNGTLPGFLFYENQTGFNFRSMETIFKEDAIGTFSYRDSNIASSVSKNKVEFEGLTIQDYEVLHYADSLQENASGAAGVVLYTKDITKNFWDKSIWNYQDNFNKTVHLDKFPMSPDVNAYGLALKGKTTDTRIAYSHDNLFDNISNPFRHVDWVAQRISLMSQINNIKLNLSLAGHIAFTCGKTIELQFPKNTGTARGSNHSDEYLSGKYLISSVRHNFQLKFHRVSMEVVKESFKGKI